jgi:hypothetical protein
LGAPGILGARQRIVHWEDSLEQPAPKALKEMLMRVFKDTRFCKRLEIYNPGHGPHDDGSAIDIFLDVNDPGEYTLAAKLAHLFALKKSAINWGAVIFNRQTWDNRGGPVPYEKAATSPHTDHIHVEWGEKGRETKVFPGVEAQMEAIREEVLKGEKAQASF